MSVAENRTRVVTGKVVSNKMDKTDHRDGGAS